MPAKDKEQLSTWISPELAERVRELAASEDRSVSSWLKRLIVQALEANG